MWCTRSLHSASIQHTPLTSSQIPWMQAIAVPGLVGPLDDVRVGVWAGEGPGILPSFGPTHHHDHRLDPCTLRRHRRRTGDAGRHRRYVLVMYTNVIEASMPADRGMAVLGVGNSPVCRTIQDGQFDASWCCMHTVLPAVCHGCATHRPSRFKTDTQHQSSAARRRRRRSTEQPAPRDRSARQ